MNKVPAQQILHRATRSVQDTDHPTMIPLLSRSLVSTVAGALSLTLFAVGCASVSVQPEKRAEFPPAGEKAQAPQQFVVEAFAFPDPSKIRADRSGVALDVFERDLQVHLQDQISKDLRKLGLTVLTARPGESALLAAGQNRGAGAHSVPTWVISGQFTRVNQGSRALRVVVGLGAGGTKMETAVQMFDPAAPGHEPALAFRTTGGSGAKPGVFVGAASTGPAAAVGLGLNVVGGAQAGVAEDTRRTARMITAYISEELAQRGYLDPAKVRHAKRLGTN